MTLFATSERGNRNKPISSDKVTANGEIVRSILSFGDICDIRTSATNRVVRNDMSTSDSPLRQNDASKVAVPANWIAQLK